MRKTALALFFVATSAIATPIHETPKWHVAYVRMLVIRDGQAALDGGELYGPWRTEQKAKAFCASVPTTAARCDVVPVMPPAEWLRKGAR